MKSQEGVILIPAIAAGGETHDRPCQPQKLPSSALTRLHRGTKLTRVLTALHNGVSAALTKAALCPIKNEASTSQGGLPVLGV